MLTQTRQLLKVRRRGSGAHQVRLGLAAEGEGRVAGVLLEEVVEVSRVLEAEASGNAGDAPVGVL